VNPLCDRCVAEREHDFRAPRFRGIEIRIEQDMRADARARGRVDARIVDAPGFLPAFLVAQHRLVGREEFVDADRACKRRTIARNQHDARRRPEHRARDADLGLAAVAVEPHSQDERNRGIDGAARTVAFLERDVGVDALRHRIAAGG
jgi:hypothetical protein